MAKTALPPVWSVAIDASPKFPDGGLPAQLAQHHGSQSKQASTMAMLSTSAGHEEQVTSIVKKSKKEEKKTAKQKEKKKKKRGHAVVD